jgi:hypothetical protein
VQNRLANCSDLVGFNARFSELSLKVIAADEIRRKAGADSGRDGVVETSARTPAEPARRRTMTNSDGQDVVRELVVRELRATIRAQQRRGASVQMIHDWIERREAGGDLTEEEGAIARLIARHYTEVTWEAVYTTSINGASDSAGKV